MVLSTDGTRVASAYASCQVRRDAAGAERWQGVLMRIEPAAALRQAPYRLRLPDGAEGRIRVATVGNTFNRPETATFTGDAEAEE